MSCSLVCYLLSVLTVVFNRTTAVVLLCVLLTSCGEIADFLEEPFLRLVMLWDEMGEYLYPVLYFLHAVESHKK